MLKLLDPYPMALEVKGGMRPAMYEPNQFCMNCGIVDGNAGPIRFYSPIGRNLNDGDSIILLVRPNTTQSVSVQGTVRYAITLQ